MKKYILITGASRGIGLTIAKKFASMGHNLIINSTERSKTSLLCAAEEIKSNYNVDCITFCEDISNFKAVSDFKTYLDESCDEYFVEAVINNAGISHIGLLQDMSFDEWNNIISVNLGSVFNTCRIFLNDMIRLKEGHIINISSVWGNVGASCEVAYSASKGGINSFTKALAKELAPSNISVNAVSCGAIDTAMNACFSPEEISELENEIPYGRMGKPEEVADLVYNIYKGPSYMTGQIITIDGGWI